MTNKSIGFLKLEKFIKADMRMSHIYQPIFLKTLLENNGSATDDTIAKAILEYDPTQLEYYKEITKKMPAKVLLKHGLIEKESSLYRFASDFKNITIAEARLLGSYCEQRLAEYLLKHGDRPFYHRKKASGYISGSTKYEVLKKAKSRCAACGISNTEKALEVDHIVPRNKGGSDDFSNLQALCYSCNAMKRDSDDTDFLAVVRSYSDRQSGCLFCEIPKDRVIDENELAYVIEDGFPVTPGHTLIIPKRHVASYFDVHQPEINACNQLIENAKSNILARDPNVSGFNIGINIGEDAGQTIFHCHIHLIPRRKGDVEKPKGGVRGVIPGKQSY